MANRIVDFVLKRSNVIGKVPLVSNLQLGGVALNTADAKLYSLYTSGNTTPIDVREIGWDKLPLTGGTITGNLIVDGVLSASSISGLIDNNEFTTGGTYNSGTTTITFTSNSGNTYDVTGITTSTSGIDDNEFTTGGTYTQSAGTIDYGTNSGSTYQVSGLSVYGTEFNLLQSTGVSVTTSTTFQQKINGNTTFLPIGLYKMNITYGWSHDATTSDMEARASFDGTFIGVANDAANSNKLIHKQEPKDSAGTPNGASDLVGAGTVQRYGFKYTEFINVTSPGIKNVVLEYRTDVAGAESTIWNTNIEIIRVQ